MNYHTKFMIHFSYNQNADTLTCNMDSKLPGSQTRLKSQNTSDQSCTPKIIMGIWHLKWHDEQILVQ